VAHDDLMMGHSLWGSNMNILTKKTGDQLSAHCWHTCKLRVTTAVDHDTATEQLFPKQKVKSLPFVAT